MLLFLEYTNRIYSLILNFCWLKRWLIKHRILDLWTGYCHLKIVLDYSWKPRQELVRPGEWDCVSMAGVKECWFCPNEFRQETPDHRSEPAFPFRLLTGTTSFCSAGDAVTESSHLTETSASNPAGNHQRSFSSCHYHLLFTFARAPCRSSCMWWEHS